MVCLEHAVPEPSEAVAKELTSVLQRHERGELNVPLSKVQALELTNEMLGWPLSERPNMRALTRTALGLGHHIPSGSFSKAFCLAARLDGLCLHGGYAKLGYLRMATRFGCDKATIRRWREQPDYREMVEWWRSKGPSALDWEYPEPPADGEYDREEFDDQ